MAAKLFSYMALIWLTFAFLDWVSQQAIGSTSAITIVFSFDLIEVKQFLFIPVPIPQIDYLSSLWELASLDFWFFKTFNGYWTRFFFGGVSSSTIIYYLFNNLMPLMVNLAGAAGSLIRAVNPFGTLARLLGR